jgi:hypothetical protein
MDERTLVLANTACLGAQPARLVAITAAEDDYLYRVVVSAGAAI